jgi:hypothetical protein
VGASVPECLDRASRLTASEALGFPLKARGNDVAMVAKRYKTSS